MYISTNPQTRQLCPPLASLSCFHEKATIGNTSPPNFLTLKNPVSGSCLQNIQACPALVRGCPPIFLAFLIQHITCSQSDPYSHPPKIHIQRRLSLVPFEPLFWPAPQSWWPGSALPARPACPSSMSAVSSLASETASSSPQSIPLRSQLQRKGGRWWWWVQKKWISEIHCELWRNTHL